jgi:hypothetical protein
MIDVILVSDKLSLSFFRSAFLNCCLPVIMIEIIVVCIIIIAILVSMLRDAKNQISVLKPKLEAAEKESSDVKRKTGFSSKKQYDHDQFKSIGVLFSVKNGERKESEYYIERGDCFLYKDYAHDVISERYERDLDDKGRCIAEWRHTECDNEDEDEDVDTDHWSWEPSGMILKTEYEYGDANSSNPTKTLFYDQNDDLEAWLDCLLDENGRDLAYIRHRTHLKVKHIKDIGYYERNANGDLLNHYEKSTSDWSYNLEDIPSKFKEVFKDANPYYEYLEEKDFEDGVGEYSSKARCIRAVKENENGSLTQSFERRGRNGASLEKATHYFPNEDNALVTVTIDESSPRLNVHLDFTKDHKRLISEYKDVTTK